MSSFNTPDESVQDTVAQLISQTSNTDVVYNDASDDLTVGLSASRSADSLKLTDTGTGPSLNGEITNNNGKVKVKTDGQVGELGQKGALPAEQRLIAQQTGSYF